MKITQTKNWILLLILIGAPGYWLLAQRPCDTLLCKDGRRIPAQIIKSKEGYIYYYNCSDFVKTESTIARESVQSVLPANRDPDKNNWSTLEKQQRTDAQRLSKGSITVMAGMNLVDYISSGYYYLEDPSPYQYSLQLHPKSYPIQLLCSFRPYYYHENEAMSFQKKGLNAEFTFGIKKISVGRFTGRINKGYWGVDFQLGRRNYIYQEPSPFLMPTTQYAEATTWALMARFGLQHTVGPFYWDLAFSTGIRKQFRDGDPSITPSFFIEEGIITIQPLLNVGIRF